MTLALEMPEADVVATDISDRALAVARAKRRPARRASRVRFVRTSLLEGLAPGFDLIVSNPPYVPDHQRQALSSEVRDYEPREAVFGGLTGSILFGACWPPAARLAPDGRLLMEFGAGQDEQLQAVVSGCAASCCAAIRDDLQGIPRMAVIRRREANRVVDR